MKRLVVYFFATLLLSAYTHECLSRQQHRRKNTKKISVVTKKSSTTTSAIKPHRQVNSYAAKYITKADSTYLDALHTGEKHLVWCTYYGKSTHGRRTASGEIHNMNEYVCAHLTLPFGTRIKLRNPKNGKEIIVKVNDRGPHSKKFKLDLSYGAARELDFLRAGIAQLEMTVLDK